MPYAQVIGCLLWPVVISCLDAVFMVGILSQFIQNPGPAHWEGVKRIITYLGNMKNLWLTFGGCGNTILDGFCDADWVGQPHRYLIARYSFHMGVGAITWSYKKQYIIALLTTEAEYIMQTHTVKEAMYLHAFVQEIHRLDKPIIINRDNPGAIVLSKDNRFHTWTKHIDIQYHFIQKEVEDGKITYQLMKTQQM